MYICLSGLLFPRIRRVVRFANDIYHDLIPKHNIGYAPRFKCFNAIVLFNKAVTVMCCVDLTRYTQWCFIWQIKPLCRSTFYIMSKYPAVGVSKPIAFFPSFYDVLLRPNNGCPSNITLIFDLKSVAAAELWWHLSHMKMIKHLTGVFLKSKISLTEALRTELKQPIPSTGDDEQKLQLSHWKSFWALI